jgi:hypothetical protein
MPTKGSKQPASKRVEKHTNTAHFMASNLLIERADDVPPGGASLGYLLASFAAVLEPGADAFKHVALLGNRLVVR